MKRIVFLEGVAILIGTIIGSGYLTLPYSFLQAGVTANIFWLVFFALCVNLLHLLYAEVVVATPDSHRLPGYVGLYLGKRAEFLATISFILGVFGGLLVYLLLGVHFLGKLVSPWGAFPKESLLFVFWILVSCLLFVNFKLSSKINLYITVVTVALFIGLGLFSLSRMDVANLSLNITGDFFFPYGLILYSLIGSLAIPEIINLLKKESHDLRLIKPISLVGTLVPALIYFIFAFGIFSAAGKNVTPDGLSGLVGIVPFALIYLASLMAFLEIITSYFTFEVSVFQTLRKDFNFKKKLALGAVVFLPLIFFFLGATDFLKIMGVMGSVLVSADSILVVLAYLALKKAKPGYQYQLIKLPIWLGTVLIIALVIGGALGLVYSI